VYHTVSQLNNKQTVVKYVLIFPCIYTLTAVSYAASCTADCKQTELVSCTHRITCDLSTIFVIIVKYALDYLMCMRFRLLSDFPPFSVDLS